jgi:hypothetical protein
VVADHDGIVEGFQPLTDGEARAGGWSNKKIRSLSNTLEKRRRHLQRIMRRCASPVEQKSGLRPLTRFSF